MNLSYYEMRQEMVIVANQMWERRLTNAAGGNFAVRVDEDKYLISPSLMSERKHCMLTPEDFLLVTTNGKVAEKGKDLEVKDIEILEGTGALSREALMHVLILYHFPEIECTIHAHPFYCMPFVAYQISIPSATEATMNRGTVDSIEWTKAYSEELSRNVYQYFEDHRETAVVKPIGMIMPKHGVVVSGGSIYHAYSMLERIECEAYCETVRRLIDPARYDELENKVDQLSAKMDEILARLK
ncbi:MAG: class II aldolase/adducin family protein [Lachnospiraceae bacterium]|nr:class II aldolase/adducin family protein [Lachnospiraceae bacterium]